MSHDERSETTAARAPQPTERQIAERAYHRWLARGCPTGDGHEDWYAAEAELRVEQREPWDEPAEPTGSARDEPAKPTVSAVARIRSALRWIGGGATPRGAGN